MRSGPVDRGLGVGAIFHFYSRLRAILGHAADMPAYRAHGFEGKDVADDEPVKEHPERRELRRSGCRPGSIPRGRPATASHVGALIDPAPESAQASSAL